MISTMTTKEQTTRKQRMNAALEQVLSPDEFREWEQATANIKYSEICTIAGTMAKFARYSAPLNF